MVLSSASVNPKLSESIPHAAHAVVYTAFSHLYADLEHAETYYRLHSDWLQVVFVQPGALVVDEQRGHTLDLEKTSGFCSFADLAAGMIEIAGTDDYDWKGVSVLGGKDTKFNPATPLYIAKGLLWHAFPWMFYLSKRLHLV